MLMSYDLMVFDQDKAPDNQMGFLEWYKDQTEWKEDHNYDEPNISSIELRSWFLEMIRCFPAMNGSYSDDDIDDVSVSDYSIGKHIIYIAFSWSEADRAYDLVRRLAEKHAIGFFDCSGEDGEIYITNPEGKFDKMPVYNNNYSEHPKWMFWKKLG